MLNEEMTAELLRLSRHDDPAEQLGLVAGATREEIAASATAASTRWRTLAMMNEGRTAGHRARDVLTVLEDMAIAALEAPADPAAGSGAPLPPVRVDPAAIETLRTAPMVPAGDKRALELLLAGTELAAQLGAPPGAPRAEIAGYAAALSARFRVLTHRPLSLRQRRAAETLCDAYEAIWSQHHQDGSHPGDRSPGTRSPTGETTMTTPDPNGPVARLLRYANEVHSLAGRCGRADLAEVLAAAAARWKDECTDIVVAGAQKRGKSG
nr:hypothetical protein GCM10020093_028080 [Planobispora longispora]